MTDKVVTLKTKQKNNGKKLIELQKMKLSQICMDYMTFTNKVTSAMGWNANDVALSYFWGFHYVVAERYVLTFDKFSYYIDMPVNPITGPGIGAVIADLEVESEDEYEGWTILSHNDSFIVIPDQETMDYIIQEINAGNVDIS